MKVADVYKIIMNPYRCSNCYRQLFKGKIRGDYHIEAYCTRCKRITVFDRCSIAKK